MRNVVIAGVMMVLVAGNPALARDWSVPGEVQCLNMDYLTPVELTALGYNPSEWSDTFFVLTNQDNVRYPAFRSDRIDSSMLAGAEVLWGCRNLEGLALVALRQPTGAIFILILMGGDGYTTGV